MCSRHRRGRPRLDHAGIATAGTLRRRVPRERRSTRSGAGEGPRGGDLTFAGRDCPLRGYAAAPAVGSDWPALVLIPDVRGLYDHFRDLARRFAAEGFLTLALDPYSREGAPVLADAEEIRRWMRALPDGRLLADVEDAVSYLAGQDAVRSVGVVGYCMGGQYALMAACSDARIAACTSWYPLLRYDSPLAHKPHSPLDLAPSLHCPFLGLFGAEDAWVPSADVAELTMILEREGKTFEIACYAGAGHAFFNDTRPDTYRRGAATAAWRLATDFLSRTLGRGSAGS